MIRFLLCAILTVWLIGCVSTEPPRLPLSVAASSTDSNGYGWHMAVAPTGLAKLTMTKWDPDPDARESKREFRISEEQFRKLAVVLQQESFFSLKSEYGQIVPDGGNQTITVRQGDKGMTVTLHFLMNWVYSAPWKLGRPARALKVFSVVRSWIEDGEVPDTTEYEERIFKAAGRKP